MLNDWSPKVRAILKEYCPGNIKKLLPSLSQSGNTRFLFGYQKLCMDNNTSYFQSGDNGRIYQFKIYKKMLTPNYGCVGATYKFA